MNTQQIATLCGAAAILSTISGANASIELTNSNRGFELGDVSGWEYFPSGDSTFAVTSDANSGAFAGEINVSTPVSNGVIKQANLGIGQVEAFQEVSISFWAKGGGAAGGVQFAEFFSEIDGGGVSSATLLGGAPLFAGADWSFYSFDVMTGADVSGGVTLQFVAVTGGDPNGFSQLLIDDVSMTIVPAPSSVALLGLGGLVATRRRRD